MMTALYSERRSQLEWLTGVPAWPGLAAAAMLGLAGSVLGVASDLLLGRCRLTDRRRSRAFEPRWIR